MSFVVDSSVALAWCFEDEHTEPVMDLLDRIAETGAIAPSLWPLEGLNGLLMAERRKRLDASALLAFCSPGPSRWTQKPPTRQDVHLPAG